MSEQKKYTVQKYYLKDDGRFPNNETLPLLLYKNALEIPVFFPGHFVSKLFEKNGWTNSWKDGIFDFLHYHSTTHEAIAVYKGKTTILVGGNNGIELSIEKGDVLVIPAGVAHKNLTPENTLKCVGAYPGGKDYDMNYGKAEERPQADKNIRKVPLPKLDPVEGKNGALQKYWKRATPYQIKKKKLANISSIEEEKV